MLQSWVSVGAYGPGIDCRVDIELSAFKGRRSGTRPLPLVKSRPSVPASWCLKCPLTHCARLAAIFVFLYTLHILLYYSSLHVHCCTHAACSQLVLALLGSWSGIGQQNSVDLHDQLHSCASSPSKPLMSICGSAHARSVSHFNHSSKTVLILAACQKIYG